MKIQLFPKEELLATWAKDKLCFAPDAEVPPLCLRCGKPLHRHMAENALSRMLDVHVCEKCGTAEAVADELGLIQPLTTWHAVRSGRITLSEDGKAISLSRQCCFQHILDGPTKPSLYGCHSHPISERAYSRSDCDGYKWWTNWFPCQTEPMPKALIPELNAFMEDLLSLPEFQTLQHLKRACDLYAEYTKEPTEYNLYTQTEHFYVLLNLATRERDYNLYCHFYDKAIGSHGTT